MKYNVLHYALVQENKKDYSPFVPIRRSIYDHGRAVYNHAGFNAFKRY